MSRVNDLETLRDEELLGEVTLGNALAEEVLYARYKSVVRSRARNYYLAGGDSEDLLQEGMIGLYKAVCTYSKERNVPFLQYAILCIDRQILTAVKLANRKKHSPLNEYVSIHQPLGNLSFENSETLADILPEKEGQDPEDAFIGKESFRYLNEELNSLLSTMEKKVLRLYTEGMSYQQIAASVGKPLKSVDNAIQRIKKKVALIQRANA